MKKKAKNVRTSIFWGMVLLFLFLPTRIIAYESEIDGLKYEWTNTHDTYGQEKIKLIGYNSSRIKEDLTIPTTVKWVSNDSRNKTQCVVNEVKAGAFKGCSKLISVNFGILTSVYSNTFENCTSLKTISLSYVRTISQYAFKGCSSLIEIHVGVDTPPSVYEDSFDEETYKNATLFVPEGKIETYRAHEIWNKFEKISDGTTTPQEYTLKITSVGNGSASYNGTTIRGNTSIFTVPEGTSATITFTPDNEYQIQSVKVNGSTVTVSNNQYTISNISQNTTVEVEFTNIPTSGKFEVDGLYYNILSENQVEVTYKNENGNSYSGILVIPEKVQYGGKEYNVSSIGEKAFYKCTELTGTLTIPNSVTLIGDNAFSDCSGFTGSLTIPNSVKSIGNYAFSGCSGFTGSLTIPNSVKSIGNYAFYQCSGFTGSLTIPNSVTFICGSAFYGCTGFTGSLTIPNSVTSIGDYAFYGCRGFTGSLTFPNSVTSIGDNAFYGCSGFTGSLTIPNSVTSIGKGAFWGCSGFTGSLTIPNSVTSIGGSAFGNCSGFTGSLTIPNSVTSIGGSAFGGCSGFTGSLTIPDSVTSINEGAFRGCSGFTSLIIPKSVTSIDNYAFQGCSNLCFVSSQIVSPFAVENNVFSGISPSAKLEVPEGTKNDYQALSGWAKYFKEIYEIGAPPTAYTLSISASGNGSAFYNNTTIRSKTSSFTVNEGTSATITFTPDNGYRIKSVKVNNTTVSVTNNQYTITSISSNTTISVEFEAITYTLSITATGNGSASYSNTTIRSKTTSFTVNEGTNATITFAPDNGYQIKSVKVNNTTVSVSNNQYTISNINANTTVSVEFEAITYTLSITASGSGSASYGSTTIRSKTNTFTMNAGSSATITFSPDNGYRIKSVKVNNTTVSVSNNQYTISNINANTTVSVEFEAITYTLSITASGSGSASYGSTTIRSKTNTFTVNAGSSATITFTPDNGYRIKSVKVNNSTVSVSNNQYTISSINANTTVSVEFEAITYTLSITASGNGSASYSGSTIRSKTSSFTVNAGTSATITFSPDNGYRIKSVKVNNSAVSVSNNQYTISSINANTTVSVEFEAIPVTTTYTLSITASGNGSASYSGTTIRSKTSTFTVNAGMSATISFTPDNGYRIKSVKVNNSTVSVSNNQYTISNINANTTVSVEFEAIPVTTYTLSITASGSGYASYGSTTIRSKTNTFTVNAGTSATISFTPDNGYRIKSVKVNNSTVSVSNNQYTISSINANTTVSVEFEAIPPTTYTLSISASGNGSVSYNGTTIRDKTSSFTVNEGTSATITFTPDNGYQIKSVKVNKSTVSVSNNQYTISSINANTTMEVEFEAIPITTCTLSIKVLGSGSVSYGSEVIRNETKNYTVNMGTSVTVFFNADAGSNLKSLKVNGMSVSGSVYFTTTVNDNTTIEVEYEEVLTAFSAEDVNYTVVSVDEKTIRLASGSYGAVLEVPAKVNYQDEEWTVTGIDNGALADNSELTAIIWHPETAFTEQVSNPNLLLYVNQSQYAPSSIKNVVVNGNASSITLTDAPSGNDFYCPQAFTAQKISYTHNYGMKTGIGKAQGWETIALPFDVQKVTHESKGEIVSFANWKSGDAKKPFWLMQLSGSGWTMTTSIKANTPYIISMPNNDEYKAGFLLNGSVTFSAENVTVAKTENLNTANYSDRTFVPTFASLEKSNDVLALNVVNDIERVTGGSTEGSKFERNLRPIHPFEAYMTSTSSARFFGIDESMATSIDDLMFTVDGLLFTDDNSGEYYDLQGRRVKQPAKGVYIYKGKKVIR